MAYQPLTAGELRSRLRVEVEARVPNGQGGFTTGWSPVVIVWAKKVPLRGDEMTRESITRSVSFARFVIRPLSALTVKHRLVEVKKKGSDYEVVSGPWDIKRIDDPFGRADRLEVDCEWIMGATP
jgi:head-tail adaptor